MHTHAISRPRVEDAADIHGLVAAYDISVIGTPDATLDDIADELVEPGFDRDKDGWLARDADGVLNGWAWACRKGDSDNLDVEVTVRPGVEGLSDHLWSLVLERSREIATELGHQGAVLDIGVYRADEAKQAITRALGFEPATSFHRLRIDFDSPVEAPRLPPGLTLHDGAGDEAGDEVRRQAHLVHQEGFAEHFGFVASTYEQWHERRQAASSTDWSQLLLARVGGEPAALVIGANNFVADEGCGYVATLAVRPAYRGRGLGRLLLRTAFAADAERGRKGAILHVDSNNTTPALGLYTSAGMRSVLVMDVWRLKI